jgi:DcuC family C4-dicarboxylate transporter
MVSGSGMAATQGTFGFFAAPALAQNIDPAYIGSIVSLAAAAGRTMSPVAAVMLMSAKLTNTDPVDLVKRVALPLLLGLLCTLIFGALMAPRL